MPSSPPVQRPLARAGAGQPQADGSLELAVHRRAHLRQPGEHPADRGRDLRVGRRRHREVHRSGRGEQVDPQVAVQVEREGVGEGRHRVGAELVDRQGSRGERPGLHRAEHVERRSAVVVELLAHLRRRPVSSLVDEHVLRALGGEAGDRLGGRLRRLDEHAEVGPGVRDQVLDPPPRAPARRRPVLGAQRGDDVGVLLGERAAGVESLLRHGGSSRDVRDSSSRR